MKLYENTQTSNSRRVRIFLAEKGIEIPRVQIDIANKEHLSPAFLAKNPFGTVPVLELDDGTLIAESIAICVFIDMLHPEPTLFGLEPRIQGIVEMWNRRIELNGMFAAANILRNTNPLFENRGLPGVAEPVPQIPALAERDRKSLERFITLMDAQLAAHPFAAGDRYSVADITLLVTLDLAKRAGITELPANLQRWYQEINARPSSAA